MYEELIQVVTKAIEEVTIERQGRGIYLVTGYNDSRAFAEAAVNTMIQYMVATDG